MSTPPQKLRVLPDLYAVDHAPDATAAPADDSWLAVVRAPEGGLTVVRHAGADDTELWIALYGDATAHGLDVPGMLAAVVNPLAAEAISVFVVSTYHADLVLVPQERTADAVAALQAAGHDVAQP